MKRTEVSFVSGDGECAAWLYRPSVDTGDVPCVVMGHGFSLTRYDGLRFYAEAFAAAGAAVLVYDHLRLGDSGGWPRQHIRLSQQLRDRRAAIAYARGLAGIDPGRIFLWGYSLGAGSAVDVAASDSLVAGVILLCPMLDGLARARYSFKVDPRNAGWLLTQTAMAWARGGNIPVTAAPGSHAVMNLPGEAEGFAGAIGPDSPWRNEVSPRPFASWAVYRPLARTRKLTCPVLVQAGERDISAPAKAIRTLTQRARSSELKWYDVDHFQPFEEQSAAGLAEDQAAWLTRTAELGVV